jgi:hypothetical protein
VLKTDGKYFRLPHGRFQTYHNEGIDLNILILLRAFKQAFDLFNRQVGYPALIFPEAVDFSRAQASVNVRLK